jgi:transmembrane protein
METSELVNLLGRFGVAFYFGWALLFNIGAKAFHLGEFKRIGIDSGEALFWIGQAMMIVGVVLLLVPATVAYGAGLLIIFTLLSDALFHRFWTYPDPKDATIHKFFLYEHVALAGGLLGLASLHL